MLHAAENRVLRKFVYAESTVRSRVICGRECSMDEDCKSINFNECNSLCELNNVTMAEHTREFFEDQGSVYFDADDGTPLFSLPDVPLGRYTHIQHESCHYARLRLSTHGPTKVAL